VTEAMAIPPTIEGRWFGGRNGFPIVVNLKHVWDECLIVDLGNHLALHSRAFSDPM
jgi:hypothetical protein